MKKEKNNTLVIVAVLSIVTIFILFIIVIWKMGLFTFSGDDSSAKIVAATFTLLGALFASVISLIGLVLKHSIDLRSIAIQEQTELREKEAERRLKIEAAIKSIELLSTSTGGDVPAIRKAGVVLSLGNLEMYSIAIALSEKMLNDSSIDLGTVCWLVNKAIIDGDNVIKEQAVLLISDHTDKMLLPNGEAVFPSELLTGSIISLPESARRTCVWTLVDLITSRPYEDWSDSILVALIESLYILWKNEKAIDIKTDSGVALLKIFSKYPPGSTFYFAEYKKAIELCDELKEYSKYTINGNYATGLQRMQRLSKWAL